MKTSVAQKCSVRKWKLENKDKVSEANKRYYETHKEYHKEYYKAYSAEHQDEQKERWSNWYATDKRSLYNKEYSKTHPEINHRRHRVRKARKLGVVGGHFTDAQFAELCDVYGNKCLCCGKIDVKLTADHIVPLILGAPHSDEISNIQPLCQPCNSRKGTKTVDYR